MGLVAWIEKLPLMAATRIISNRIISNIIISNIAVRVAVVLFIVGVKPLKLYPLYTVFLKG